METFFESNKPFNKAGSRLIFDFAQQFQNTFIDKIMTYAESRLPYLDVGLFEHGFFYGEQQTKTYVTTALDEVCNGRIMQEYPVDRKNDNEKRKKDSAGGKLDYWCQFGNSTNIDIMIEVKQAWIRYYEEGKYTFFEYSRKRHISAVEQIKHIENKMNHSVDNLYSLALTLLPVYTRYKNNNEGQVTISKEELSEIGKAAMKKSKAHAYGCFIIPHEYCPVDTEYQPLENQPAFVFLWSIFKNTKK